MRKDWDKIVGHEEDVGFLTHLQKFDEVDAIDVLYDYVDNLFDQNECQRVNDMMSPFEQMNFGLRLTIAFLTITHMYRSKLPNRPILIAHAITTAVVMDMSSEQIEQIIKGF